MVVASRSSTAPSRASAVTNDAWRSRASTCVATGAVVSPSPWQTCSSTSGGTLACVPTAPVIWPTAISAVAAASRDARATHLVDEVGELDAEGERLGVDAVGAAHHHREAVALGLLDQRRRPATRRRHR